jgi:hypothetical protein
MRKYSILSIAIIVLISLLSFVHASTPIVPWGAAPTSGSTLFFDDFVGSGFPSKWSSGNLVGLNGAIQVGGYLISTVQRPLLGGNIGLNWLLANVSGDAPIASLVPESIQFIQISFKMQPFNLTSPIATASGNSYSVTGEVQFGLNTNSPFLSNAIFFDVFSSTSPLSNFRAGFPATKQAIFLNIFKPMASTPSFFSSGVNPNATLYNGGNSPIDLAAQHIFTIQIQMDLGNNANDYVRYEVDNNGWEGYQQTACNCIVGPTGDIIPMFPFIDTVYRNSAPASPVPALSQSMASQTDWVLVTNYVPTSQPAGQILNSNSIPPSTVQPLGGGASLTQFLQFEANSISPGNLYAGGMLLTIIVSGTLFGVLFGLSRKLNISFKGSGLFFTMLVLVMSFLFFYASIIPVWIPVMMTLIVAGIAFGVIRSGNAGGGLVPD